MKKIILIMLLVLFGACSSTNTKKNKIEELRKEKIMAFHLKWRGVPYRLGGNNQKGIDCSALVQILYKEQFGIDLPRTTATQVKEGKKVSRKDLKIGDLVFFKTGRNTRHVGVYIGDNQFVHASTSRGVMISTLNNYWNNSYWQGRRIL